MHDHLCIGPISKISPAYHEPGVSAVPRDRKHFYYFGFGISKCASREFLFQICCFCSCRITYDLTSDLLAACDSSFWFGILHGITWNGPDSLDLLSLRKLRWLSEHFTCGTSSSQSLFPSELRFVCHWVAAPGQLVNHNTFSAYALKMSLTNTMICYLSPG